VSTIATQLRALNSRILLFFCSQRLSPSSIHQRCGTVPFSTDFFSILIFLIIILEMNPVKYFFQIWPFVVMPVRLA
jgi:hypothetical protein